MANVNKPSCPTVSGKEHMPPTGRLSNAPRQSTATQIRLKVIQGSVERLMSEVEELGEIKQFLVNLRNQMEEEADAIRVMTDIAFESLECDVQMPEVEDDDVKGRFALLDSRPKIEELIKEEKEEADLKMEVKETDPNYIRIVNVGLDSQPKTFLKKGG